MPSPVDNNCQIKSTFCIGFDRAIPMPDDMCVHNMDELSMMATFASRQLISFPRYFRRRGYSLIRILGRPHPRSGEAAPKPARLEMELAQRECPLFGQRVYILNVFAARCWFRSAGSSVNFRFYLRRITVRAWHGRCSMSWNGKATLPAHRR
jgi:hypothetical protein